MMYLSLEKAIFKLLFLHDESDLEVLPLIGSTGSTHLQPRRKAIVRFH